MRQLEVDVEAAASYPKDLDGNYGVIDFNVDKTALYWKISFRTFIAREQKSIAGFKALNNRLTLALKSNAVRNFKLKPMLTYHSQNPRTLKNYTESILPILYKWNNKAWMTTHSFITTFIEYIKSTVETYCREKEKKILFKIQLLTDNELLTQEL